MAPIKKFFTADTNFWQNSIVVILSVVVLFFLSQLLGAVIASSIIPYIQTQNLKLTIIVACNLITALVLLHIAMQLIGFKWNNIGLKKPKRSTIWLILPAFLTYFITSTTFTVLATRFIPGFNVEQTQDIGFSNTTQPIQLVATFLSLVVLTPIFEEIIFRGVLFRALRRTLSFWITTLIVSALFAVAHLQWNVAVDTFALSILLCFLAEKSGSVLPSIGLHALKNSLAFALLFVFA